MPTPPDASPHPGADPAQARSGRLLLRIGALGAGITAVCWFTPLLVIALGAAGLLAALPYLDWALLPLLMAFLVVMLVGWHRLRRARAALPPPLSSAGEPESPV